MSVLPCQGTIQFNITSKGYIILAPAIIMMIPSLDFIQNISMISVLQMNTIGPIKWIVTMDLTHQTELV